MSLFPKKVEYPFNKMNDPKTGVLYIINV